MKNFENDLIKTPLTITFSDDSNEYICYFHPSNEKTYYQVGEEFLMIVDPSKVKEIKTWYESSAKKKKNSDDEEE